MVVHGNQIRVSYRLDELPIGAQSPRSRLIVEMVTTDTTPSDIPRDRNGSPPGVTLPTRSVQRAVLLHRMEASGSTRSELQRASTKVIGPCAK